MFDLEQAIAEWRRQLLAAGIKPLATLDELESHLREQFAQLDARESTEADRFQVAVSRLGQTDALKREFAKVKRPLSSRLRDNPPLLIFLAAWFMLLGLDVVGTVARLAPQLWWVKQRNVVLMTIWGNVALVMSLQFFAGIGLLLQQNRWRLFAIFTAIVNVSFTAYLFGMQVGLADHNWPLLGFMISIRYTWIMRACNLLVMAWALRFLSQRSTRELFQRGRPAKIA
jgi:hypothetical protein